MRKLKLLLDKTRFNRKPNRDNIVKIYNRAGKKVNLNEIEVISSKLIKNQVEITVEDFIEYILQGCTWTMAYFKKWDNDGKLHRTKVCWDGQELFALDIDNGLTPEQALDRCKKFGIMPVCIYASFSDSPAVRKFRVIFVSDKTVTDYRDANAIIIALMRLFPECDQQCKDLNRLYFGGKELLFNGLNNTISPVQVIQAYCRFEFLRDNKSWKRNIRCFCNDTAINMDYKGHAPNCGKSANSLL